MNAYEMKQQVSMQKWQQIILDQKATGMSVDAYCEKESLSRNSFYYWQRKIRDAACTALEASDTNEVAKRRDEPVFTKIELPARNTSSGITIKTTDSEINIAPDSDPAHVRIIMEALVYAQR